MKRGFAQGCMAVLFVAALGVNGVWADSDGKEYGHGKEGSSHRGGYGSHMGMMHGGTGHFIKHLLKHEKEIGLTSEQVDKLKGIQDGLEKTRTKAESDVQAVERELRAMVKDDKADMGAIEKKLKESAAMQTDLRLAAIKARREALALLTPEQREKEKAEHDRAMEEHRKKKKEYKDNPHSGDRPH